MAADPRLALARGGDVRRRLRLVLSGHVVWGSAFVSLASDILFIARRDCLKKIA